MSDPQKRLRAVIKTVCDRLAPAMSTYLFEQIQPSDHVTFAKYIADVLRSRVSHDVELAAQLDAAVQALESATAPQL